MFLAAIMFTIVSHYIAQYDNSEIMIQSQIVESQQSQLRSFLLKKRDAVILYAKMDK